MNAAANTPEPRNVPTLQGKQAVNPHPEDVRVNARYASYPNEIAERQALQEVDRAVWEKTRTYEEYLIAGARKSREDAQVDTTAAQDAVDALQSEIRYALDRPVRELDMPALAARYKTLKATAEQIIAALERADRTEETWAAKLADPYGDLCRLWDAWPMIRPLV